MTNEEAKTARENFRKLKRMRESMLKDGCIESARVTTGLMREVLDALDEAGEPLEVEGEAVESDT